MQLDNARKEPKAHSFPESRLQVKNIINNKGVDGADSSFGQWPVTVRGRAGRLVIERMPARTEVEIGQSWRESQTRDKPRSIICDAVSSRVTVSRWS